MPTINPTIVFREPLKVSSRDVRNGIMKEIYNLFSNQILPPFAGALIDHLNKMGSNKLDIYKHMTFILEEYNVKLEIVTTAMTGEDLTYVIPKGNVLPPDELRRTKFLGLF